MTERRSVICRLKAIGAWYYHSTHFIRESSSSGSHLSRTAYRQNHGVSSHPTLYRSEARPSGHHESSDMRRMAKSSAFDVLFSRSDSPAYRWSHVTAWIRYWTMSRTPGIARSQAVGRGSAEVGRAVAVLVVRRRG